MLTTAAASFQVLPLLPTTTMMPLIGSFLKVFSIFFPHYCSACKMDRMLSMHNIPLSVGQSTPTTTSGSSPCLDSCCRSSWSISPPLWVCQLCLILDQSVNHLGICPVYNMILIAHMICDCRFVADTGCPGLFCSSEDSCDTIHFFTMFFYSCSQWPSCFSNVDTFTVFTRYFINHLWLFLVTDSVFGVNQQISQRSMWPYCCANPVCWATYGTSFYILTTDTRS